MKNDFDKRINIINQNRLEIWSKVKARLIKFSTDENISSEEGLCDMLFFVTDQFVDQSLWFYPVSPTRMTEYFPELLEHEPEEHFDSIFWWHIEDHATRLRVVEEIISKLKSDQDGKETTDTTGEA